MKKRRKRIPEGMIRDAMELVMKMETLRVAVDFVYGEIERLDREHPDEVIESMGWEEKEAMYKRVEELMGRTESLLRELGEVDIEYNKLVEKVNEHYGYEKMKKKTSGNEEGGIGLGDEVELW